ncbi:MAG: polysaccharide biosynthesis C-terminal domain-containing protein [Cyclobacteriaceae bacterium]|nr:polysaccharide biosynthesis C-terminal domain-containing protein [Cyclobacteriaceae bacterium]
MLAVIGISLNLETIKRFVLQDELYWTGLHIVPLLLMGSLFLGLFYNLSIWFKIQDKTIYGTIITVMAAVVTIVLNLLLIPVYGYLGSAITTLVVYLFMCVVTYLVGQKYYPIHYDIKRVANYLFLCTLLLVAGWHITTSSWIITQLLREIPILLFLAALVVGERKRYE